MRVSPIQRNNRVKLPREFIATGVAELSPLGLLRRTV